MTASTTVADATFDIARIDLAGRSINGPTFSAFSEFFLDSVLYRPDGPLVERKYIRDLRELKIVGFCQMMCDCLKDAEFPVSEDFCRYVLLRSGYRESFFMFCS
jgi:hypothetical protein